MRDRAKVVLLDDDEDICELVTEMVKSCGFRCEAYSSAASFYRALNDDTGLILLDMHMPQMNGLEVLKDLGERDSRIPILLMSGTDAGILATAEATARCLGLTVVGRLNKPFRLAELQSALMSGVKSTEQEWALPRAHSSSEPAFESRTRELISDEGLLKAVEEEQFVVHYQPQIVLASGRVAGVEALVRWDHPQHGLVFPESFLSRLESLGLMERMAWLVCRQALDHLVSLQSAHGSDLRLSLNISADTLLAEGFASRLLSMVLKRGLRSSCITLEVKEEDLLQAGLRRERVVEALQHDGFQLSTTGLGGRYRPQPEAGFAPANELKISRSVIDLLVPESPECVFTRSMIERAHASRVRVVAEGVETEEQRAILQVQGCDLAQGFLFGRPMPPEGMVAWLLRSRERA